MDPSTNGLRPSRGDALLVVDVQNDFLPKGALPVPDGDAVIAPLNAWAGRFAAAGLPVFASRDWHPPSHCSFRSQGGPWPPHCLADSLGAAFAPGLELPPATVIVSKGDRPGEEAYSAFEGTALADTLREGGVRRLFVGGLATDYCVLHTVRDALQRGFEVVVLGDAVRAVNVHPEDGDAALRAMRGLGAAIAAQPPSE